MEMKNPSIFTKPETTSERRAFYERLAQRSAAPLWEVLGDLIPAEPQTRCVPVLWRYDELRPLLIEAGELLTAREAERRVLILENPGYRGESRITHSLFAGLQLVQPGEIARAHRHVTSALRFVIESSGGFTSVSGEKATMHPGDFIITPSWTFHDHGNPGDTPVIWMDGLDVPLVNTFDTSFAERYRADTYPVTKPEGDPPASYGECLAPLDYTPTNQTSPVFSYPYARSRETLERIYRNGPVDPWHGVRMQYVDPVTGGNPMPTISAFLQLLPSGFQGEPYRSTDATIYCPTEGGGQSHIGDAVLEWSKNDIFVVPSWHRVTHHVEEDTVLFSFSDRVAQKALGLWREEQLSSA